MKTYVHVFCLVLFPFLAFAQGPGDVQAGGFIYGWSAFDSSHETGLGEKTITHNFTGIRDIKHAPAIGEHPRIFFDATDIPDIQNRLANTASGQSVAAQIHAYTTLLNLGYTAGGYSQSATYALDADGERYIANAGFWDSSSQYAKLISGDATVWDAETVKRRHITSCMMALEAFECLMNQGTTDPDTGESYADRAADLATAMAFWASLAIADTNVDPANYNLLGGTHYALAYDLAYNFMTTAQQDLCRQAIAKIIPAEPLHGGELHAFVNASNWSTLNSFEIIINLSIEGETGYNATLTSQWVRALHNFITYGWYPSGAGLEGLGKNYQFTTTMIALAKRGYSLLGHPHVRAYGEEFLPAITQPFGHGFTSYDVWGGSGYHDEKGGYKFSPADAVGLKWAFPNSQRIDFVWRNYIEKAWDLSSTGYVYQQIRPDDSYYNYLLPAAIFCQDYTAGSWASQASTEIPQDYFAPDRGLAVMRSGTDADDLAVQFHCRQDMGGHTHGDRNDFTLSALGRIWFRKSYGGSQFQPTSFHSCILIDDLGVGVGDPDGDKCRQPGTIMDWSPSSNMTKIAGDATYAYTWEWHWSPQPDGSDHPWLGSNNWEKVLETWNDFQYQPKTESYYSLPFYDWPHWHQENRFERMVKRPYNPMEKVHRTLGVFKGECPWVLVTDDLRKDANTHNFKWLGQIARDLTIESTDVNLVDSDYRCDIILAEPAGTGNRRLLVRVLHNEGYTGAGAPGYTELNPYIDYFSGLPYTSNPNLDRPRLIIESNSVEPDFKVMLFPFTQGDPLPQTTWNATGDTLTFSCGMDDYRIAFEDISGRTDFHIVNDVLPVEWGDFYGKIEERGNRLYWNTISEIDSKEFIVEHSRDGISFNAIGTVNAQGQSLELHHYQFLHENPEAGLNYYRLTEVALDGQKDFSEIIVLDNPRNYSFKIHPNPVRDQLFIRAKENIEIPLELVVWNAKGEAVLQTLWNQGNSLELQVAHLPAGKMELGIFEEGRRIHSESFIKIK